MRLIRFAVLFFALIHSCFVCGEETKAEAAHVVVLPYGTIHEGDFFAWGSSVEISGTVNGDVYVFAEQLIIDGVVNGDVLASGGSVDISGQISRSVRAVAGQILINGKIGHSVTGIGGNIQLLPYANIGGNVVLITGNGDIASTIGSNVTAIASNLRVSATINNSLQGYIGHLRITSRANIGGEVDYRSNSAAWIDQGARIQGKVVQHPSFVHELVKGTWIQKLLFGSKVLAILMNFIYTFTIGVILIKFFPKTLEMAQETLKEIPLKCLGCGIVMLIILPLISLIMLMTILGVPFALTLIAANIIGLYTAKIYTIFWISNWGFRKLRLTRNRVPTLLLGLIVYFSLTSIPYVGIVLATLAMLIGLGAGILSQTRRNHPFGIQTKSG